MTTPRKRLSDILQGDNAARLQSAWDETEAADDLGPLPAGEYTARVLSGELFKAAKGTPGYKLACEVSEGEYAGRRFWHDLWLTDAALAMTKRDLQKLGITSPEQLDRPLPVGILIKAKLSLRKSDNGIEYNRVQRFEFVGTEPSDTFCPDDATVSEEALAFDPAELERASAAKEPETASSTASSTPGSPPSANGTPDKKGDKQP